MQYRKLGNTETEVSVLGFGAMRLPVINGQSNQIDEERASEMLEYAIARGVNYIDTAFPYHRTGLAYPGESEPFVGKFLKNGYRDKVKIATKLPTWMIKKQADMD